MNELNFSNPDDYYYFAEEAAKIANEWFFENKFEDAFSAMYYAVASLKQYREYFQGPKIELDFEIGMYTAELNYYRSHFLLGQKRHVLGEREARKGHRTLDSLPQITNLHANQKRQTQQNSFLHAVECAQEIRDSYTDPFTEVINAIDMADLMGKNEKVSRLLEILDSLRKN